MLYVLVPEAEHAEGLCTYPDAEAMETDERLLVVRDGVVLAEYPVGRYLSWELVEAPH